MPHGIGAFLIPETSTANWLSATFRSGSSAVRCSQPAFENPPAPGGRVQVFNQMTETPRVRDLAKLVAELTGAEIDYVDNPRKEDAENDLLVANDNFLELGLNPTTLRGELMSEVTEIAHRYAGRADLSKVPCTSQWIRKETALAAG